MTTFGFIICIFLLFVITFAYIRGFIFGLKHYQLNKSAYKKRKKGETFKEWFFYSRYKNEIPIWVLILYFTMILIHIIAIILCIVMNIIKEPIQTARDITIFIFGFDTVYMLIIGLMFWSPGPGFAYERWIKKNRGMPPKR